MSAATVTIRPYHPKDFHAAVGVLRDSTRAAYTFMDWPYSDEQHELFVAGSLQRWSAVRLAELDGTIVGLLCLDGGHVDQLFVRPRAWRRGVGSALMAEAKALKPDGLTLYTFQANAPARAFYEAHGFVAEAFGVSEAEGEPDVFYRWVP